MNGLKQCGFEMLTIDAWIGEVATTFSIARLNAVYPFGLIAYRDMALA